jgi:hypothetical protein
MLLAAGLLQFLTGSVSHVSAGEQASTPSASPTKPLLAIRHARAPQSPVRVAPGVLLALTHRTSDPAQAGELFSPHSWYSPPPPPPPAAPLPPAAPTAPPLPYTLLGSYTDSDNSTVYFVAREDRVYDVKPGDALDQTYSVAGVEDGKLIFLYKPLNVRQSLPIGGAP